MIDFSFKAPSLIEPNATPDYELQGYMGDAPGSAKELAESRKLAFWLESAIRAKNYRISKPEADEGGWILSGISGPDGFTFCVLGGSKDTCSIVVSFAGSGAENLGIAFGQVIEDILKDSPEIFELQVSRWK
jgi:hypothetical protein